MPGMTWNAEAHSKLLLYIIHKSPPSALDYAGAARMFSQGGVTCTVEAIRQQVKSLKKKAKEDPAFNAATDGTDGADKSVQASKTSSPAPVTKGRKRGQNVVSGTEEKQAPKKRRGIKAGSIAVSPDEDLEKAEDSDDMVESKIKKE